MTTLKVGLRVFLLWGIHNTIIYYHPYANRLLSCLRLWLTDFLCCFAAGSFLCLLYPSAQVVLSWVTLIAPVFYASMTVAVDCLRVKQARKWVDAMLANEKGRTEPFVGSPWVLGTYLIRSDADRERTPGEGQSLIHTVLDRFSNFAILQVLAIYSRTLNSDQLELGYHEVNKYPKSGLTLSRLQLLEAVVCLHKELSAVSGHSAVRADFDNVLSKLTHQSMRLEGRISRIRELVDSEKEYELKAGMDLMKSAERYNREYLSLMQGALERFGVKSGLVHNFGTYAKGVLKNAELSAKLRALGDIVEHLDSRVDTDDGGASVTSKSSTGSDRGSGHHRSLLTGETDGTLVETRAVINGIILNFMNRELIPKRVKNRFVAVNRQMVINIVIFAVITFAISVLTASVAQSHDVQILSSHLAGQRVERFAACTVYSLRLIDIVEKGVVDEGWSADPASAFDNSGLEECLGKECKTRSSLIDAADHLQALHRTLIFATSIKTMSELASAEKWSSLEDIHEELLDGSEWDTLDINDDLRARYVENLIPITRMVGIDPVVYETVNLNILDIVQLTASAAVEVAHQSRYNIYNTSANAALFFLRANAKDGIALLETVLAGNVLAVIDGTTQIILVSMAALLIVTVMIFWIGHSSGKEMTSATTTTLSHFSATVYSVKESGFASQKVKKAKRKDLERERVASLQFALAISDESESDTSISMENLTEVGQSDLEVVVAEDEDKGDLNRIHTEEDCANEAGFFYAKTRLNQLYWVGMILVLIGFAFQTGFIAVRIYETNAGVKNVETCAYLGFVSREVEMWMREMYVDPSVDVSEGNRMMLKSNADELLRVHKTLLFGDEEEGIPSSVASYPDVIKLQFSPECVQFNEEKCRDPETDPLALASEMGVDDMIDAISFFSNLLAIDPTLDDTVDLFAKVASLVASDFRPGVGKLALLYADHAREIVGQVEVFSWVASPVLAVFLVVIYFVILKRVVNASQDIIWHCTLLPCFLPKQWTLGSKLLAIDTSSSGKSEGEEIAALKSQQPQPEPVPVPEMEA